MGEPFIFVYIFVGYVCVCRCKYFVFSTSNVRTEVVSVSIFFPEIIFLLIPAVSFCISRIFPLCCVFIGYHVEKKGSSVFFPAVKATYISLQITKDGILNIGSLMAKSLHNHDSEPPKIQP